MADRGPRITLSVRPPLDAVDRRVRSLVLTATARAYGYRPCSHDDSLPPVCPTCEGDGCDQCHGTGDACP